MCTNLLYAARRRPANPRGILPPTVGYETAPCGTGKLLTMSPAFRPRSFLDRPQKAFGREQRSLPVPQQTRYQAWGVPPLFRPEESLDAYGYNVWLYRSVLTLAVEMARIPLRPRVPTADGFEYLPKHQALDTRARPQEKS
jgi:hypothetical protein